MKKIVKFIVSLFFVTSMIASVAAAPVDQFVESVNILPMSDLILTPEQLAAGYTVNVSFEVNFRSESNQGRVESYELLVSKNSGAFISKDSVVLDPPVSSVNDKITFTDALSFDLTDVGTYVVKVVVGFTGSENLWADVEDTEEFVVTQITIVVEYPAAAAIAAELLKAAGVSAKYGKNGNHISDVARLMGLRASFMGFEKSDYINYRNAVEAYLESVGALVQP
ncbi:MAG: hypothetical protein CVU94_09705 [Firmicutes bacterium HGW-Firmicutes-19]|jgi:hypothetical protein|nr:MAG: hypothetical protein CVU94_09705 [Firmicutes bacterium HGW-Firmicutes-19]